MAKKQRTGEEEPGNAGRPDATETGETAPEQPRRAASRPGGEAAPAGQPALSRQSLERLRRKLKTKFH
jgi:hypothetical protein